MSDEIISLYYKVISTSTARRIIFLLGEGKCSRATELIETLDVSPGTFYDALKKLKGVVEKTEDGRYQLTPIGKKLYYMLVNESKGFKSYPSFLINLVTSMPFLFPISLIRAINRLNFPVFFMIISATVSLGVISSLVSGLIPVGLFLFPPYFTLDPQINAILFVVNLFFVMSLAYFFSNIFGEVNDSLRFCLIISISFVPLILFSFVYYLLYPFLTSAFPFVFYLLFSHIPILISFTILTTCIFIFASLRIEVAFIVSLIILLITYILSELLLVLIL